MKLIKSISKDEVFLDNNSIIFNIELYQNTPVFKMPPLPPSELVFKTDMLEETDHLNEISKGIFFFFFFFFFFFLKII